MTPEATAADRPARPGACPEAGASAAPAGRLHAAGLVLRYRSPAGDAVPVLRHVGLALPAGAVVGITGPSGSGKTSLLCVLAGIEQPQAGTVRWGATAISALGEGARDAWRRRQVGLVFQDFHLLPGLSIEANVLASCFFDHARVPVALRRRAAELLAAVGVPGGRGVASLSRGEQQRVALARALLREPPVLLADEPTASLDAASGRRVADLLLDHAARNGATLVVASHDEALLARLERIYRLDGGVITALAAPPPARPAPQAGRP